MGLILWMAILSLFFLLDHFIALPEKRRQAVSRRGRSPQPRKTVSVR